MVTIYEVIKQVYPTATSTDFQLRDDGEGIYLAEWNEAKLGAAPTIAQLEARKGEVADPSLALQNEATINANLSNALANLRTYLALSNPTSAQNTAVLRVIARVCVYLIRRTLRVYDGTD